MSGMLHHNKRFSVPAANPGQDQGEWEGIFGSEEERKKKMPTWVEETKKRKKGKKADIVQLVGDATDGFTTRHSEMIEKLCEQHRIPSTLVKSKTREVFTRTAEILKGGGNIQKDDR